MYDDATEAHFWRGCCNTRRRFKMFAYCQPYLPPEYLICAMFVMLVCCGPFCSSVHRCFPLEWCAAVLHGMLQAVLNGEKKTVPEHGFFKNDRV
jgi:hypothetical protein